MSHICARKTKFATPSKVDARPLGQRGIVSPLKFGSVKSLILESSYEQNPNKIVFNRLPAGLMSNMFRSTDIVPSDFVAGFVLLRVKQKRESREQRRLALLAEQRYNCTSSESKWSPPRNCVTFRISIDLYFSVVTECLAGKPDWMCLKKARHYLQLSVAIYGWPFLIYRYCITGLFKMMPKFLCCACFR